MVNKKISVGILLLVFNLGFVVAMPFDFGGMYSLDSETNASLYDNPATNDSSCPTGYNANLTYGYSNSSVMHPQDNYIFYCYRERVDGQDPFYDFGGMYGSEDCDESHSCASGNCYGSSWNSCVNPITDARGCSSGYISQQITSGKDNDMFYCYRPHTKEEYYFGGMYGSKFDYYYHNPENDSELQGALHGYPHVVTGNRRCVEDYISSLVLYKVNVDYPLKFCYSVVEEEKKNRRSGQEEFNENCGDLICDVFLGENEFNCAVDCDEKIEKTTIQNLGGSLNNSSLVLSEEDSLSWLWFF